MDENYNIVPHGVNFQDPIFPDTAEVHRMFASLFQFSNCTAGTQVHQYTPEWEAQEDSRVCSISNGKAKVAFYNVFFLHLANIPGNEKRSVCLVSSNSTCTTEYKQKAGGTEDANA